MHNNQCRGLRHFGYCKTTLTVPYRKYEPFYDPSRHPTVNTSSTCIVHFIL